MLPRWNADCWDFGSFRGIAYGRRIAVIGLATFAIYLDVRALACALGAIHGLLKRITLGSRPWEPVEDRRVAALFQKHPDSHVGDDISANDGIVSGRGFGEARRACGEIDSESREAYGKWQRKADNSPFGKPCEGAEQDCEAKPG